MAESPVGDESFEQVRKRGGRWGLLARLGVTAACFAVLFSVIDLSEFVAHVSRLDAAALVAALVLHLLIILLLAWRWRSIVLALGRTAPFGWAARLTFVTAFLNLVLPLSVGGDLGRVWLGRKGGLDFATGMTVAVLDRMIGLLALGLLALVSAMLLPASLPPAVRWLLLALLPSTLIVLWLLPKLARQATRRWVALGRAAEMADSARRLSHRPRRLLLVTAQSVLGHLLAVLCAFAIAEGLELALTLTDALLLFPVVLLASMLPFSVGGWGMREAAAISVFAMVGMPPAGALSLSLVFGLTQLVASGAGALVAFVWPSARWNGART